MIKRPIKGVAVDDLSQIRLPCIVFPKIDGFRCVLGQQPLTSRLGPFPNAHFNRELTGLLPAGATLDSEVVVGSRRGKGVLGRTSSGLTTVSGEPDFRLWCFDSPTAQGLYDERLEQTAELLAKIGHRRIRLLRGQWIEDLSSLEAMLEKCLRFEYEGIITRGCKGIYKQGKSTLREQFMLKVKPFEDAEGRVIGWYEEMENTNEAKREVTGKLKRSSAKAGKVAKGRLGGLILKDVSTGVEVRVGGGFTKRQRIELWEIKEALRGKLVRYKKQKMGEKDKPRHPNFVEFMDFRPEWDFEG